VSVGIEKTLRLLSKTKNESATEVLVSALDSLHKSVSEGSLRALMDRRTLAAEIALVQLWDQLPEVGKAAIKDKPGRIAQGLRDAILSKDEQTCVNGCAALLDVEEYDLLPALVTAAEDRNNPQSGRTADTVLQAAKNLAKHSKQDRNQKASEVVRNKASVALEQSVNRFDQHQQLQLLEAFVLLANRENGVLRKILESPLSPAHDRLLTLLSQNQHPRVPELLMSLLDASHASAAIVKVVAQRSDAEFLHVLLKHLSQEIEPALANNLKRMKSISWLGGDTRILDGLPEDLQPGAVTLMQRSSLDRSQVFSLLEHLAENGTPVGRRAAFAALQEFHQPEANELIRQAINDQDAEVQAIALSQVRKRKIPGAMTHLITALDSSHEVVREAARDHLDEFSFKRFLAAFDMLSDEVRQSTGRLVSKVDRDMERQLNAELSAQGRNRKIRAMQAAPLLQASDLVEERLLDLLGDSDHFVRAAAATALGDATSSYAADSLREALLDRSTMVQEAAEEALQKIASQNTAATHMTEPMEWTDVSALTNAEV